MRDLKEALDSMPARDVERLIALAEQRLRRCAICGSDGGIPYLVSHRSTKAAMTFCPACFQKHRLPEGRAQPSAPQGVEEAP